MEMQPELPFADRPEQLTLFEDIAPSIGKLVVEETLNRWDDMGNYFEGDDRFITVFQHGHVDRYGPLGDPRSIAEGEDW